MESRLDANCLDDGRWHLEVVDLGAGLLALEFRVLPASKIYSGVEAHTSAGTTVHCISTAGATRKKAPSARAAEHGHQRLSSSRDVHCEPDGTAGE